MLWFGIINGKEHLSTILAMVMEHSRNRHIRCQRGDSSLMQIGETWADSLMSMGTRSKIMLSPGIIKENESYHPI